MIDSKSTPVQPRVLFDMKQVTLFLVICLLVLSNLVFGQAILPGDAQSLVDKLTQWEKQREAEYTKEIALKRQQVVTALQSHLKNATKRGDLDGALAIRNFIKALQPETISNEEANSSRSAQSKPGSEGFTEVRDKSMQGRRLNGKKYLSDTRKIRVIEFSTDNKTVTITRDDTQTDTFPYTYDHTTGSLLVKRQTDTLNLRVADDGIYIANQRPDETPAFTRSPRPNN